MSGKECYIGLDGSVGIWDYVYYIFLILCCPVVYVLLYVRVRERLISRRRLGSPQHMDVLPT